MLGKKKNIDQEMEKIAQSAIDMKAGSAEAFHFLYEKYNQKIYRFCLRMLGDEETARDAFQETFIKVFEKKDSFRGDNFSSWLYTIARNTCLNYIRSQRVHDPFNEFYHAPIHSMKEDVGLKEQIEDAINMVPIKLREAFVLREYEGSSYQEISEILNIDISLAKVRVFRARKLLRKILKPVVKELNES